MKKILLLFFTLIFANSYSQSWVYVSAIPVAININTITVVDQNIIWVCCDGNSVYKTTNGGINWLLRNNGLPSGNLYGISALDTTNCWVGTVTGSIYRTSNGGVNWTMQFSFPGSFTNGLKMFNMNYGVSYGDPIGTNQPYQLRFTTNGGLNWNLSPNSPIASNEFGVVNAWDWTDTSRFWIGSANLAASATTAKVYRTTSGFGGGGWTGVNLTGTGGTDGLYYQAVAFTNNLNGLAGSNGGDIRRTTDGGVTWTATTPIPGVTAFAAINMNGLKDGSNAIRVSINDGLSNYCFRTTDLGATWVQETLPSQAVTNGFQHMQFINSTLGFAGGNAGTFFRYGNPSSISMINNGMPSEYTLEQNYPNPFNPTTKINFSIPEASNVTLKVYDALGKEITTLVNGFKSAGNYSYDFTASSNLTSGVYFYTLSANNFVSTKKLTLIK